MRVREGSSGGSAAAFSVERFGSAVMMGLLCGYQQVGCSLTAKVLNFRKEASLGLENGICCAFERVVWVRLSESVLLPIN
jgi:hypothetical protein